MKHHPAPNKPYFAWRVCNKVCPLQFLGTDYTDYTDYTDFS